MSNSSGATGFAIGVVVGAVVGVVIGLLYAPRSGEESRELLKERAREVLDKGTEIAGRAKGVVSDAGRRLKEKLEEA